MLDMSFSSHIVDNASLPGRTWLVVGKGPSFESFKSRAVEPHTEVVLGLNHVAGQISLDYWHVFDIDVLDYYDISILEKVNYLIIPDVLNEKYDLPFCPHVQHRPIELPLAEVIAEHPILRLFNDKNRLLVYERGDKVKLDYGNPEVSCPANGKKISTGSYSASTVVNLLAVSGVSCILLAGIDGGRQYAQSFSAFQSETLLDSGNDSFDIQFSEIAYWRYQYKLSICDIRCPEPIKIYVGAKKEQQLAFEVLAYSIEKYASVDVDVLDLSGEIARQVPEFDDEFADLVSGTPFSYQRFVIPELMGYQGVGVYLDSDMQVFGDIRQLIGCVSQGEQAVKAAEVRPAWGRDLQLSVLVIDASRCDWNYRSILSQVKSETLSYKALFSDDDVLGVDRTVPSRWNSLEEYRPGDTCLVHFTDMRSQPWLSPESALAPVWCAQLIEYTQAVIGARETLKESVENGWVRPGLQAQVQNCISQPVGIGPRAYFNDYFFFKPPHLEHAVKQLQGHSTGKFIISFIGKNASYRLMRILIRVSFLLKLKKIKAFLSRIFVLQKNRLRSRL